MQIHIEELTFDAIIGILDFERTTPQKLILTIRIDYSYNGDFINYAEVSQLSKELFLTQKFHLLEDALITLSRELKSHFPLIEKLFIKITKPNILPDCKVSLSETYEF